MENQTPKFIPKEKFNPKQIFFTSDLHFGEEQKRHQLFFRENITKTPEEFDKMIIDNWNKTVGKDDYVFVVGDVAYSKKNLAKVALLNGKKP
jgi:calcineurin-like phosphoesterase family protein